MKIFINVLFLFYSITFFIGCSAPVTTDVENHPTYPTPYTKISLSKGFIEGQNDNFIVILRNDDDPNINATITVKDNNSNIVYTNTNAKANSNTTIKPNIDFSTKTYPGIYSVFAIVINNTATYETESIYFVWGNTSYNCFANTNNKSAIIEYDYMDYSNNFFNFSNKEYIHNVYLTCQVNLTYIGPSSAPATSDFGSNFVQWNGLIANYVSQNWNNINSTDSYLITARDMSYLPPDLNNAVGITYYNAQNYSLIGRPSFILCDRITGGYKEIDILRCITHEIGHKRKINGHNCSTDCDGCCVMEPSLPFTCTHYPSSFHFCKEHKCTIYLNDF